MHTRLVSLALLIFACGPTTPALTGDAGDNDAEVVDAKTNDASDDSASKDDAADAASTADASDGGATGCATQQGLLFCEDFEKGLDSKIWTQTTQLGSVALDTTAHSGSQAVHVHIGNKGDSTAQISETKSFPVAGDAFFARAWVRMTGVAPTVHTSMFEGSQASPFGDYSVGIQFQNMNTNGYWETPFSEGGRSSATAMPINAWSCFEWQFDGTAKTVAVWLNGTSLADLSASGWAGPKFDTLTFGLHLVGDDSSATGFDLWLDDLAVGTKRVGCN